jgi:hypothetical protein
LGVVGVVKSSITGTGVDAGLSMPQMKGKYPVAD